MQNLTPQEVYQRLQDGDICLIDVREENEYAEAHIDGAILCPLSSFDPAHLPDTGGKPVVFHCAGGVRSAKVVNACQDAGLPYDAHMAGGIRAWIADGLPVER